MRVVVTVGFKSSGTEILTLVPRASFGEVLDEASTGAETVCAICTGAEPDEVAGCIIGTMCDAITGTSVWQVDLSI